MSKVSVHQEDIIILLAYSWRKFDRVGEMINIKICDSNCKFISALDRPSTLAHSGSGNRVS